MNAAIQKRRRSDRRAFVPALAAVVIAAAAPGASLSPSPNAAWLIKNVRLVVGDGRVIPSASLLIRRGRIEAISEAA